MTTHLVAEKYFLVLELQDGLLDCGVQLSARLCEDELKLQNLAQIQSSLLYVLCREPQHPVAAGHHGRFHVLGEQ